MGTERMGQCPTTHVVPNQQRPPLGRRPSVSNGRRPRRSGQRILFRMNKRTAAGHRAHSFRAHLGRPNWRGVAGAGGPRDGMGGWAGG
eukprot:856250-Pyramimonas_sp.AAC.1